MEDLIFSIEIDGKTKEAKIIYSHYNEDNDKYYVIFEVEDSDNYEAAVMLSNKGDEIILEDIETDEEFNNLLNHFNEYLDNTDKLKDEGK